MNELEDIQLQLQRLAQVKMTADPTPLWKAAILQQAVAVGQNPKTRLFPPRGLMIGWAAALCISGVFHLLTPKPPRAHSSQATGSLPMGSAESPTLLALQIQHQRNPDFP